LAKPARAARFYCPQFLHSAAAVESRKTVALNCDGDKTVFTVDDGGNLNGRKADFWVPQREKN
jgi:hypothetical protein